MSQKTSIENKGFFVKLVRKFAKIADFRKSTCELAQTLGNKRKNARKGRFTLNGDPNGIYRLTALPLAEPFGFNFLSEITNQKHPINGVFLIGDPNGI